MASDKLHLLISLSPLVLSLVIAAVVEVFFNLLPEKLPLFYSLPWGEGQLASHQQFLIIPASIAFMTLLNLIVSWQLHASQVFFKKALLLSSFSVSLILTITFVKIILNFI